ncbi:helix-turn-helix domain-containing protein [Arthrobacter sp. B1805]|uniref:helix-turn-helix domain-containing protein n=1 Tax=Arthrobacter sp. B1805 TaxID=2058892 RepID=UPI000CE3127C|nr:helix-turn-helix domain-containing protein [Arthrobacter sp. B1805]
MTARPPRSTAALPPEQAGPLRRALSGSADVTVFVDGTAHRLPSDARAAVVDLLARLSDGDAVQVTSVAELLTTSQAAELAGISHSYLRKLTDAGTLPVEYRGSHRRIRRADVEDWLRSQLRRQSSSAEPAPAPSPLPDPS